MAKSKKQKKEEERAKKIQAKIDKSQGKGGGKGPFFRNFKDKKKDKYKELVELYDDLIYSDMVKGSSNYCRRIPSEPNTIGIDFLGSYDGENISFYYLIEHMPNELYIDFKDRIRRECRGGTRVNFLNIMDRHKIEWDSAHMRSRLRILKQVSDDRSQEDVNAYNLHRNINAIGNQVWIEDSLGYLASADKVRGRALMKVSTLMIISGVRGEAFDDSAKLIEEYCKHIGIRLTRVLYEIPDLLKYFSPFSKAYNKSVDEFVPVNVLTDEIVARYSTYNQGTLGVGGVYFGTDVYSRFPVLKQVKPKEDTAENWLITAETGGGKSFTVKALILELLARGYNGTIMDIEGFEYIPLANFMSHNSVVEVINMAEGSGKYFDPMEIADATGIEEIDKDAKGMSVNFTLAIFKVLLGKAYAEDIWLDTVVNDAVSLVYKDRGITDDRSTWHYSKGLSLFDVYYKLLTLSDYREDLGYKSAVQKAIAITSRYFDEEGTRRGIFNEKVVVEDIVGADLVVCSFGMAGKSPQAIDEIQLALMQLGAAQLSHQRSIFSKSQGKFNFKLWEEFQRWGKFPDSDKTLGVAITGGRKLGDVNIIITNVVKELLDDDRFGILSNITSFMIGAISDEQVRQEFCLRMSIPEMKKELDLIARAQRVEENKEGTTGKKTSSPFTYAFLCGLDRSKYAVVKMVLPSDVAGSSLFKTGVNLKG